MNCLRKTSETLKKVIVPSGVTLIAALALAACESQETDTIASNLIHVDVLVTDGTVYIGDKNSEGRKLDIAWRNGEIVFVGEPGKKNFAAKRIVDANGLVVTPGFIDPHTHTLDSFPSDERRLNANYLTQGVTTVFVGNDGGGALNNKKARETFTNSGIGTNAALFIGHNVLRESIMGLADRAPTPQELDKMRNIVRQAMSDGAFGLSAGLFYTPGEFSKTEEIVELAKVAAAAGGVYESHIRDESSYTVGLIDAIDEALRIGKESGAPVHIAHIKALGVDVWGYSQQVTERINAAIMSGHSITADQYPWRASQTSVGAAILPKWARTESIERVHQRLQDPKLKKRLRADMSENIRRRGGPESLLITKGPDAWVGMTLAEVAKEFDDDPVAASIEIVLQGDAGLTSFNMNEKDIERFMSQPWVMTSSDGAFTGHPRKNGSFPRKYDVYVKQRQLMPVPEFIYRSAGLAAETFDLCDRGFLREGLTADILVFDPDKFKARATFTEPEQQSTGVKYLFVNGSAAVDNGEVTGVYAGKALQHKQCK